MGYVCISSKSVYNFVLVRGRSVRKLNLLSGASGITELSYYIDGLTVTVMR